MRAQKSEHARASASRDLGVASPVRGEKPMPQGGHSWTGLARIVVRPGETRTVVAKAVRDNRENPRSNRLYQKYIDAERRAYEALVESSPAHGPSSFTHFFPTYYGTARIMIPGDVNTDLDANANSNVSSPPAPREAQCLCVENVGVSLGRHLLAASAHWDKDKDGHAPNPHRVSFGEARSPGLVDEIWDAARFLHSVGFCHGDLKPSNVVVGSTPERARLIDLGKSIRLNLPHVHGNQTQRHRPATTAYEAATWSPLSVGQYVGAMPGGHQDAVDVFGMAVLAVDCLCGTTLEAVPPHLREFLREAYCAWSGAGFCAATDAADYAAWCADLPADWDRTPVHFLHAWAQFYSGEAGARARARARAQRDEEISKSKPKSKSELKSKNQQNWSTGTLSRRIGRLARSRLFPALVPLLGRMTHPDPLKRPSAQAALQEFRKVRSQSVTN